MATRLLYLLPLLAAWLITSCSGKDADLYIENRSAHDSLWTIVEVNGIQAFSNWVPQYRRGPESDEPKARTPHKRLVHVVVLLPFLHETAEATEDLENLFQLRILITTVDKKEQIKIVFNDMEQG